MAEQAIKVINGYIHYCQVRVPANGFKGKGKQWQVSVEITKEDKKKIVKAYKDCAQMIKEYDTEEFIKAFKTEPQASPGEDEHYVISLKQSTRVNGKPFGRPVRVLMKNPETGKLVDVTQKIDVGNGSKGAVQVSELVSKEWGTTTLKPAAIRVDELVEYEVDRGYDELGEVDESSFGEANYGSSEENEEDTGVANDEPDFGDVEEEYED